MKPKRRWIKTSFALMGAAAMLAWASGLAVGQTPDTNSAAPNAEPAGTNLDAGTETAPDAPPNPHPAHLVWIPPGTFTMGSPTNEPARANLEGLPTRVTISRGFWMGKCEVTQELYAEVMGTNTSHFSGTNLPVEQVSWFEATDYCVRLTKRERAAGRLPAGYEYRLPTEAEWEYACRASTTTAFHYGPALRSGMANFDGTSEYPPCGGDRLSCDNPRGVCLVRTQPVGSYQPNAWGLYDMHGNVQEWCHDFYSTRRRGVSVTDPQGRPDNPLRATRGGSFFEAAYFCRSAYRPAATQKRRNRWIGFRVALVQIP